MFFNGSFLMCVRSFHSQQQQISLWLWDPERQSPPVWRLPPGLHSPHQRPTHVRSPLKPWNLTFPARSAIHHWMVSLCLGLQGGAGARRGVWGGRRSPGQSPAPSEQPGGSEQHYQRQQRLRPAVHVLQRSASNTALVNPNSPVRPN